MSVSIDTEALEKKVALRIDSDESATNHTESLPETRSHCYVEQQPPTLLGFLTALESNR